MRRKRIQIFVDHDVLIRHFIHSGALREVDQRFDTQYVFPDYKRVTLSVEELGVTALKVPVDAERIAMIRTWSHIEALRKARKSVKYRCLDDTWRILSENRGTFRTPYRIMRVKALPGLRQILRRRVVSSCGNAPELRSAIEAFKPDLILHPSVLDGVFISDLAVISKEMSLPYVLLMNSWDNTSGRALIPDAPDYLAVWGDQAKQQAVEFLGMSPDRVKILGAAQFDVFRQPPSMTRQQYCSLLNIDPTIRLVLYAGSSLSLREMENLRQLNESIEAGELSNCHVVYRPHPWRAIGESEDDFLSQNWRHVSLDPFMREHFETTEEFRRNRIRITDYRDTHALLSLVDCFVCNATTMILEAAIHKKPIVCVISADEVAKRSRLGALLDSPYYREFLDKMGIPICAELSQIGKLVERVMADETEPPLVPSSISSIWENRHMGRDFQSLLKNCSRIYRRNERAHVG